MKLVLELGGETHVVSVNATENVYTVVLGDRQWTIDVQRSVNGGALSMIVGAESVEAWTVRNGSGYRVSVLGESFDVDVEDELRASLKRIEQKVGSGGDEVIRAPMPGVVVDVKAAVGDEIEAGDPIVIVEAMKMRNEFGPKASGRVKKLSVEVGESVERGQEMAVVESRDGVE